MKTMVFIVCTLTALVGSRCVAADPPKPIQPNIIFILADDLSYWDISHFGQKHFSTPNIDRLAKEGRVFANAYAGGPWCAPSRTALLTGMNGLHFAPLERDAKGHGAKFRPTVAEMLKAAGYTTGMLGKWHTAEETRDSWLYQKTWEEQKAATNWKWMPWHRGFDYCRVGYRATFKGTNGNPYFPFQIETGDHEEIKLPDNYGITPDTVWKYTPKRYDTEGRFLDSAGKNSSQMRYGEDIYREEAVKFLRANKDKPFFLYYATPLVHGPLVVKQLHQFKDTTGWSLQHKLWATMVEELDQSVGIILDELKKLGIEKNTIILFASDNGYAGYTSGSSTKDDPVFHNKGPWNRGKFYTTNGGVTVPFIAWGPGRVPAGTQIDRSVCFYDFMATAGELAGAKLPGPTDGVSFAPLLNGRDAEQPVRVAIFWPHTTGAYKVTDDWNPAKSSRQFPCPNAVLLDEKWYAIQLDQTIRLFDVLADPGMKHDLSDAHKELCARATAEFQKGR
jgi:arylsulfatase A-like enzyme